MADPAQLLAAYRAQRTTLEAARVEADAALRPLFKRYVAALFREQPGLNVVAVAGYQGDDDRFEGDTFVQPDDVERAWRLSRAEGPCPVNVRVDPALETRLREELDRFWETLRREHRYSWCVFARRDPVQPDGVRLEMRRLYRLS